MHSNEGKEDVQNFKYKIGMIYTNSTPQKYLAQNSSKKHLKKTCTCLQFFQTHTKRHFLKVNHYN